MTWRPKDWDGQAIAFKEANRLSDIGMTPSYQDLVEAGADAMQKVILRDFDLKPKNECDCFLCELDRVV